MKTEFSIVNAIFIFFLLIVSITLFALLQQGKTATPCKLGEVLVLEKCLTKQEFDDLLEDVDRQVKEQLNRMNPKSKSATEEQDDLGEIGGNYRLCDEKKEIMLWNADRNNFYCGPKNCIQWKFNEKKGQYDCVSVPSYVPPIL